MDSRKTTKESNDANKGQAEPPKQPDMDEEVNRSLLKLRIAEMEHQSGAITHAAFSQRLNEHNLLMRKVRHQKSHEGPIPAGKLQDVVINDPDIRDAWIADCLDDYYEAIEKLADKVVAGEEQHADSFFQARYYMKMMKDEGGIVIKNDDVASLDKFNKLVQHVERAVDGHLQHMFGEKRVFALQKSLCVLEDASNMPPMLPESESPFVPLPKLTDEFYDDMDRDFLALFKAQSQKESDEAIGKLKKRVGQLYNQCLMSLEEVIATFIQTLVNQGHLKRKCEGVNVNVDNILHSIVRIIVAKFKRNFELPADVTEEDFENEVMTYLRTDNIDERTRSLFENLEEKDISAELARRVFENYVERPENPIFLTKKLLADLLKLGNLFSDSDTLEKTKKNVVLEVFQRIFESKLEIEEAKPKLGTRERREFDNVDFKKWDADAYDFVHFQATAVLKAAFESLSRRIKMFRTALESDDDEIVYFLHFIKTKGTMDVPKDNALLDEVIKFLQPVLSMFCRYRKGKLAALPKYSEDKPSEDLVETEKKPIPDINQPKIMAPVAEKMVIDMSNWDDDVRGALLAYETYQSSAHKLAKRVNISYDRSASTAEDVTSTYFDLLGKIGQLEKPKTDSDFDEFLQEFKDDVAYLLVKGMKMTL